MTDQELAVIRARCEAASPAPWRWGAGGSEVLLEEGILDADGDAVLVNCGRGTGEPTDEDAAFIVNARTDVPALLAEVDRLRAALNKAGVV